MHRVWQPTPTYAREADGNKVPIDVDVLDEQAAAGGDVQLDDVSHVGWWPFECVEEEKRTDGEGPRPRSRLSQVSQVLLLAASRDNGEVQEEGDDPWLCLDPCAQRLPVGDVRRVIERTRCRRNPCSLGE